MDWTKLGWSTLEKTLKQPARALVVDDEEVIRVLLADILRTVNFASETVTSAEEALARVRTERFDVLVTDKNLPGHDGIDLIGQVRAEGIDLPCVLVTAFPSVPTISRALAHGASDYLAKPFDDVRMVRKRIESVVEQRRADRLLRRLVTEFRGAVATSGAKELAELEGQLRAYREKLVTHPDVLLVEADPSAQKETEELLRRGGLTVKTCGDLALACDWLEASEPMSLFVSLDVPGSCQLVSAAKATEQALEIIVRPQPSNLDEAMSAVAQGASDIVLAAAEGPDMVVARVKRAVFRSRRRRLFRRFLGLLLEAAEQTPAVKQVLHSLDPAPASAETTVGQASSLPPSQPPPIEGADRDPVTEKFARFSDMVELFAEPHQPPALGARSGPMSSEAPTDGARIADVAPAAGGSQPRSALEGIDPSRTVPVPVRELLSACAALEEVLRFFNEAGPKADGAILREYLFGDPSVGGVALLAQAQFEHLRPFLPADVLRDFDLGRFRPNAERK